MTIIHLTKTFSKPEDERIKAKEIFFDVEDVIYFFRKTLFHSGSLMIDVHFKTGKLDSYHSHDWDKNSWERFICTLENHFTKPIKVYPIEDQPSYLIH